MNFIQFSFFLFLLLNSHFIFAQKNIWGVELGLSGGKIIGNHTMYDGNNTAFTGALGFYYSYLFVPKKTDYRLNYNLTVERLGLAYADSIYNGESLSLAVQYRFLHKKRLQPYAGFEAGVSYIYLDSDSESTKGVLAGSSVGFLLWISGKVAIKVMGKGDMIFTDKTRFFKYTAQTGLRVYLAKNALRN